MEPGTRSLADKFVVFVAEGFGTGRMPFAPGTFGTAFGFAWVYLLLLPESLAVYLAGIVLGFFLAVWVGHRAEQILQKTDPGSIVIDEITAMPLAFLPAVLFSQSNGMTASAATFFSGKALLLPALTFFLFRFFDIVKPLGIAQVQKAPGGWGLVLDDYLAAVASAALLFVYIKIAG
jgi:phosphatidylglycerophosphatase A